MKKLNMESAIISAFNRYFEGGSAGKEAEYSRCLSWMPRRDTFRESLVNSGASEMMDWPADLFPGKSLRRFLISEGSVG